MCFGVPAAMAASWAWAQRSKHTNQNTASSMVDPTVKWPWFWWMAARFMPKAFSSLGIKLDALTQDSCAFYECNTVISDHGGAVVFEEAAGRDFAKAFGMNRAAIHQNHGHFTVGSTIDEAVFWFVCFERCAQAQLAAMAAGTPKHIPHDSAVYTRENAGNAITGWMHFQPLWQEICRTDPDLFD